MTRRARPRPRTAPTGSRARCARSPRRAGARHRPRAPPYGAGPCCAAVPAGPGWCRRGSSSRARPSSPPPPCWTRPTGRRPRPPRPRPPPRRPRRPPALESDGTVRDIRIDLTTLELRAGGRTFAISAPGMNAPFRGDAVARVTDRFRHARFSASPTGEIEQHDWVLAFLGPRQQPHYLYGTDGTVDVPGRRASTLSMIGLRTADARWLYEHTVVGAKVTLTGQGM
ncbi:hypothetical protein LT493_13130 [Streptomyces tricolor]|nr:hypothetical protein [Streptomyces tricolor]